MSAASSSQAKPIGVVVVEDQTAIRAMPTPGTSARDYQELVDTLDDVVFRFDERGRWSYLSPAWQKRLGWDVASCLGSAAARFVHAEERGHVLRHWSEVVTGTRNAYRGEVRFRHARNGFRWMLVSARGLRDDAGNLRGVTGTLTDVSAAKAVEAELVAAHTAAHAANKAKSEFLSTMSHELRTPLNAVIGLSESLLATGTPFDADRTRRYLGIIHTSGLQLLAQINDILDLARIEAGRIKINVERFDLGALAAGVLDGAQREIRAKSLEAVLQRPTGATIVHADERLIRQVMQNLVSNAVKFTPKLGRVTITIEDDGKGGARLVVSDTGIGIAPDKLALLFKPFSQVDSSLARRFGGTGLGLALVDRLVRLHGGTIDVKSAPGAGSAFIVTLPAPAARAVPAAPAAPRSRSAVLVDDDSRQHTFIGDYLHARGFEVIHCLGGPAALEAIEAAEPGLAIIDVNMPGMSGLEVIARLRQMPNGKALPIIAATALAEADEAERCRAAGADAHLPKPIALSALAQRISELTQLTL